MTGFTIGHSTAVAHGDATWLATDRYVAERLAIVNRASEHLRQLAPHCRAKRVFVPLNQLLRETADALNREMPPELPFLFSSRGMPQRLRIGAAMREWLLTSQHPRRTEQLRNFLLGYQEISPLSLAEIRLMPLALQLAVGEKCGLLPSPENITHRYLLPRLLHSLADSCRFIDQTDWIRLSEAVSPVGAQFP